MTDFSEKLFFMPMPDPWQQFMQHLSQFKATSKDKYRWIEEPEPKTEQELLRENIDKEWDW